MNLALLLEDPVVIFLFLTGAAVFNFYLVARFFVWPKLSAMAPRDALQPLLQFQGFRYIGAVCLLPTQVSGEIPRQFAYRTAGGDVLVAALAITTLWAIRREWPAWPQLAWIFAAAGLADLANAFVGAVQMRVPEDAGSLIYAVSTTYAPAGLISLLLCFRILLRLRREQAAAG